MMPIWTKGSLRPLLLLVFSDFWIFRLCVYHESESSLYWWAVILQPSLSRHGNYSQLVEVVLPMILNVYVKILGWVWRRKYRLKSQWWNNLETRDMGMCVEIEKQKHHLVTQLPHPPAHQRQQMLAHTFPLQNSFDLIFWDVHLTV